MKRCSFFVAQVIMKRNVYMKTKPIYLKAEQNVKVTDKKVYLGDVFKVTCSDKLLLTKLKLLLIYDFNEGKNGNIASKNNKKKENRAVISILKVIQMIHNEWEDAQIVSLGENDIIIEFIGDKRPKPALDILKIVFVSLICFFGTAFTIMAYHNDINIIGLFERIYEYFGLQYNGGLGTLEIGYSLGLGAGIIIFYNHVGKRKITKDPTPLEVEMRIYETDVNKTLIDNAERERLEVDVP